MTLARITNYVDGNILTGAQLNNEFDNLLNNGPALVNAAIPGISIVQGLTGSIISNIGSFQANGYQLKSTSTIASLTATSSFSVNTQTVGPIIGGRDQAAVFASTDVHFYAITTGGTSTNARGICSSQPPPTGPTLPTGYSAWAYLATAKYDVAASGALESLTLNGSRVSRSGTAYDVTTSPVVYSSFSLRDVVPQIAPNYQLGIRMQGIYASTGGNLALVQAIAADTPGLIGQQFAITISATSTAPSAPYGNFTWLSLPNLNTPPAFYVQNIITVGTSGTVAVRALSYTVPNGDVG